MFIYEKYTYIRQFHSHNNAFCIDYEKLMIIIVLYKYPR